MHGSHANISLSLMVLLRSPWHGFGGRSLFGTLDLAVQELHGMARGRKRLVKD